MNGCCNDENGKYADESYQSIAHTLKVSLQTVKSWFMHGGILAHAYQSYADEMNEAKKQATQETIAKHVDTAGDMLVSLMGSTKDEIQLRAAVEILNRVLGQAPSSIDHTHTGKVNLNLDFSYEHILKLARAKSRDGPGD